jgi:predicted NUDIX family NTP pyrophosphohydrolase
MVNLKGRIFPEVDQFKWVNLEEAKKLIHQTQVDALIEFEKLKYQF